MANSRIQLSSIKQGFPKSRSMLAGNPGYDPAATFLIQRITATGSESTMTFSSIPQTYKHIQVRAITSSTNTSPVTVSGNFIRLNGDSGANYAYHNLFGETTTANATAATASSFGPYIYSQVIQSTSGYFGAFILDVLDYTNTSKNKTLRVFAGGDTNTSGSYKGVAQLGSGLWLNTAAITSLSIVSNAGSFASGSTFALYGFTG